VLLKDKMNLLLLLLPFAVISKAAGWAAGATFMLALLPLCSLAEVRCQQQGSTHPGTIDFHFCIIAHFCCASCI
jgi:hypothetical protein